MRRPVHDVASEISVDDTPNEAAEGYVCTGTDTCTNDDAKLQAMGIPTDDPTWNFMDYSPDDCMSRFTPLQVSYGHPTCHSLRLPATAAYPDTLVMFIAVFVF